LLRELVAVQECDATAAQSPDERLVHKNVSHVNKEQRRKSISARHANRERQTSNRKPFSSLTFATQTFFLHQNHFAK
jgi:hypothetical protein